MSQPVGVDPLSTVVSLGIFAAGQLGTRDLKPRQREAFFALGGKEVLVPGKKGGKLENAQLRVYQFGGRTVSTDQVVKIIRRGETAPAFQVPGVVVPDVPVWTPPINPTPLPERVEPLPRVGTVAGTILGRVGGLLGGLLYPTETASPAQDLPPPPPPPSPNPPLPDFEDFNRPPWLLPQPPPEIYAPFFPDPNPTAPPVEVPTPTPTPTPTPIPQPPRIIGDPVETVIVQPPRTVPQPRPIPQPPTVPAPVYDPIPQPTPVRIPSAPRIPAPRTLPRWLTVPLLPWPFANPSNRPGTRPTPVPDSPEWPNPGEVPYSPPQPYAPPEPYAPPLPFAPPQPYAPPLDVPFAPPSPYQPPQQFRPPQQTPRLTPDRIPLRDYRPFDLPQPREADYDPCQKQGTKRKKPKERKPRQICYSGTYIERARGTSKTRKRRVPCR